MAYEGNVRKASLSGNNPSANDKLEGDRVGHIGQPVNVRKCAAIGGDNGRGAEQVTSPKRKGG